jgi:hypothetical protein
MMLLLKSPLDQNSIVINYKFNDKFKAISFFKKYKSNKKVTSSITQYFDIFYSNLASTLI